MKEGRIIKALSGYYYVQTDEKIYACRGRGVFRKKNIQPLVGDFVVFQITDEEEGYIQEIKPRTNELMRPPIANVDQAIIVTSAKMPDFSPLLLDRFLVLIEANQIKPVIFITKMDLTSADETEVMNKYKVAYERIGYPVELLTVVDQKFDQSQVQPYLANKVTVIAGQSGVGKTSLLNALKPDLSMETNPISKSLGRGKHTTRHVELIEINNGLVADTPGFSSLELHDIELEELGNCFPEIKSRKHKCKFRGCLHLREPNCAVKFALSQGEIEQFRYENYVQFSEEIQSRKPRY